MQAVWIIRVAEAASRVIVHHSNRLHERIADRAADKPEAPPLQFLAHGIRLGSLGSKILNGLP